MTYCLILLYKDPKQQDLMELERILSWKEEERYLPHLKKKKTLGDWDPIEENKY